MNLVTFILHASRMGLRRRHGLSLGLLLSFTVTGCTPRPASHRELPPPPAPIAAGQHGEHAEALRDQLLQNLALLPPTTAVAPESITSWQKLSDFYSQEFMADWAKLDPMTAASYGFKADPAIPLYNWDPGNNRRFVELCESWLKRLVTIERAPNALSREGQLQFQADLRAMKRRLEIWAEQYTRWEDRIAIETLVFNFWYSVHGGTTPPAPEVRLRWLHQFVKGDQDHVPGFQAIETSILAKLAESSTYVSERAEWADLLEGHKDLPDTAQKLLLKTGIPQAQWQDDLADYRQQFSDFGDFLKAHQSEFEAKLQNKSVADPAAYRLALRDAGIDLSPEDLKAIATQAWPLAERRLLATREALALRYGIATANWAEVKTKLQTNSIESAAALGPETQTIAATIEQVIRSADLISLPPAPLRIEECNAEGTKPDLADCQAMSMPQMNGDGVFESLFASATSKVPTVLLPNFDFLQKSQPAFLVRPALKMLLSHEGRPGHDLQFRALLARPTSIARVLFAYNTANVEGWALYAETLMQAQLKPDDLESQFYFQQAQLWRIARVILDVQVNSEGMSDEDATRFLLDKVGLDAGVVQSEVKQRYRIQKGQAASYFYGYSELLKLKDTLRKVQGTAFGEKAFNDFVVGESFLPYEEMMPLYGMSKD